MKFSKLRQRAVHAVRNYLHRDWNIAALLNFDEVAPFVRRQLKLFYFSLLCVSASSAFGSYLSHTGSIGCPFAAFGAFLSFTCFCLIAPWKENKRLCLSILGACFGWAAVTPWLSWFLSVDTGFVVTSIWATTWGFGCFWASSIRARPFELIYFGAMLLCAPLLLAILLYTSAVFGGDSALWKYQIYIFVLWFMIYLAAYSQEVVFKARRGDGDYVKHAICLLTDFPAFVIHLLKVLWKLRK